MDSTYISDKSKPPFALLTPSRQSRECTRKVLQDQLEPLPTKDDQITPLPDPPARSVPPLCLDCGGKSLNHLNVDEER